MRSHAMAALLFLFPIGGFACLPSYVFMGEDGGVDADLVTDAQTEAAEANASSDAVAEREAEAGPDSDAVADTGPSLRDGCILLMHMDELGWSGVSGEVKDDSGQGNNGTAAGQGATTTNGGKFGRAGSFGGMGWVEIPNSPSFNVTSGLSYAAWIFPTELSGSPGVIAKRNGYNVNVSFTLYLDPGDVPAGFKAWADIQWANTSLLASRAHSQTVLTTNNWYHLAVVYDGTLADSGARAQIYVNGHLEAEFAADPTIGLSTSKVYIGNLPNGGQVFTGLIDEVAVWNRALDKSDVLALANATGPL
jgi:hypothetical protein